MIRVAILERPFGPVTSEHDISGPLDLDAALKSVGPRRASLAVSLDGTLHQVYTQSNKTPIVVSCGQTGQYDDRGHQANILWPLCVAAPTRTVETGALPWYPNLSAARADGWQTTLSTELYRGWYLLAEYRHDRLRTAIEEQSGTPRPGGQVFRRIRPPARPKTHPVIVETTLNKIGNRHDLNRLVRVSDWLTYLEHCRELVDQRIDGRRNLDLIE